MALIAIAFVILSTVYPQLSVNGQYGPPVQSGSVAPRVESSAPPPPVFIPPPPPPPVKFPTGITLPTDVTPVNQPGPFTLDQLHGLPNGEAALQGVVLVNDNSFPSESSLKGPADWIVVNAHSDCDFVRLSPYLVELKSGTMLVSVKKPSNMGMVKTALGEIAVGADGDVLISYIGNVLRVFNMDGRGDSVKVKLDKGPFAEPAADPTVQVAAGFELVASEHKLARSEIKPTDGVARRNFRVLAQGYAAISEFSTESVLHSSELIASMAQRESGAKEKRILGDMSKMAAVLNYLNGTSGYTAQAKAP